MTGVNSGLLRARLCAEVERAEDCWMAQGPARPGEPWRDCATPVADVLRAALGYDPMVQYRGRYTTPRGYMRVLRREGFGDPKDLLVRLAARFGWTLIDPCEAEPGDIGVSTHAGGQAFVLHRRGALWIGVSQRGLALVQGAGVIASYRVTP